MITSTRRNEAAGSPNPEQPMLDLPVTGPARTIGSPTGISQMWVMTRLDFRVKLDADVSRLAIRGWRPPEWGTTIPMTLWLDGRSVAEDVIAGPYFEWDIDVALRAGAAVDLSVDSPAAIRPCDVSESPDDRALVFHLEEFEFLPRILWLPITGPVSQPGETSGFSDGWVSADFAFRIRSQADLSAIVIRGWRPPEWGTDIPLTLWLEGKPASEEVIAGPWFEWRVDCGLPAATTALLKIESPAAVRPSEVGGSEDDRLLIFRLQEIDFRCTQ